jgi:hypothetical protein
MRKKISHFEFFISLSLSFPTSLYDDMSNKDSIKNFPYQVLQGCTRGKKRRRKSWKHKLKSAITNIKQEKKYVQHNSVPYTRMGIEYKCTCHMKRENSAIQSSLSFSYDQISFNLSLSIFLFFSYILQ